MPLPRLLLTLIYISLLGNIYGIFEAVAAVRTFSTADGMSHDRIVGLCQDERGVIWICTWYGIDRYDGYEFQSFRPQESQDGHSRFKKASFGNDSIFVTTVNGKTLAFSLSSLTFKTYDDKIPPSSQRLTLNLIDRSGNEWSGTHEGVMLTGPQPDNYHLLTNPAYPYVRAIYEDSAHRLWVAWCDGPEGYTDGEVIVYDSDRCPTGLNFTGKAVYSILEDSHHNMWLGTRQDGLYVLQPTGPETFAEYHYTHSDDNTLAISYDKVFDLMEDSDGRIWIATLGGGINVVESGYDVADLSFQTPTSYPTAIHPRTRSLQESRGRLLIATENGLIVGYPENGKNINDFTFKRIVAEDEADGPAEELILLTKTADGRILISSFGKGIREYVIENDSFRPIVADDIAEKQPVFSVLPLDEGEMWVVAHNDLFLYDTTDKSCTTPIAPGYTMLETKPLADSRGQSWFATKEGLLCVKALPDSSWSALPPTGKVVFTQLVISEADLNTTRNLSYSDTVLTLTPAQRNSNLSFSALDFGNPERLRYYWRVAEKDTIWTEIPQGHTFHLSTLSPGEWTVEIRSTDASGHLLDNAGRIRVNVEARWHEKPLVRGLLYGLIALTLIFVTWLLIRYRRLQVIYTKLINSQPVAVMTAAITEIKDTDDLTNSDKEFIDAINTKLESELGNSEFSIDDLVATLGMSRSVFYRRLKAIVGQSPSEYINQYRLRRAATMLRDDPNKAVAAIAYECGFSSPQYFSNLFRKRYQMTPNEWRKNAS